jgi:hypothetical protein
VQHVVVAAVGVGLLDPEALVDVAAELGQVGVVVHGERRDRRPHLPEVPVALRAGRHPPDLHHRGRQQGRQHRGGGDDDQQFQDDETASAGNVRNGHEGDSAGLGKHAGCRPPPERRATGVR